MEITVRQEILLRTASALPVPDVSPRFAALTTLQGLLLLREQATDGGGAVNKLCREEGIQKTFVYDREGKLAAQSN